MNFGVFERVFNVQTFAARGTAFAIERGGRQYLVTASHIFENLADQDELQIAQSGGYFPLPVQMVGRSTQHDVLVLTATKQLCSRFGVLATPIRLMTGQDAHFLGFPGEEILPVANGDGYPMPLVKRATISAIVLTEDGSDFLIDGIITKGFSGGPLVYKIEDLQPPVGNGGIRKIDYCIAGIVTNSKHFLYPLLKDGKPLTFVQAEFPSGIGGCCSIYHANRLIDNNPIGFVLPDEEAFGPPEQGRIANRAALRARLNARYGDQFEPEFI
jgi:hypothetical protein